MITKTLEGTRNFHFQDQCPMQLEYYLIETEIFRSNGHTQTIYGVEIVKKNQMFDRDITVESDMVDGVFETKEHAEEVINTLIGNSVTPVSLVNVIDDLLETVPYI